MKINTKTNGAVAMRRNLSSDSSKSKKSIRFKSIVVPIDFSETSIKALDYAIALANQFGSKICLVHVLDYPTLFNTAQLPYVGWDRETKASASNRLAALIEEKFDGLIPVTSKVVLGRAFKSICDTARGQKADLIVIGTHGFTGLKHLLLGSTAERVIRHASCSVLTVHSQPATDGKIAGKRRRILVPTDFSEPAEKALQSAVEIAQQFQMRLQLLYVVPVHYSTGETDAVDFAMLAVAQKRSGQKQLSTISQSLLAKQIAVTTKIRTGRPATEIVLAAEEFNPDLIILSTHGVTGWRRAVLGSTTEEVVRHSTCPVLVVREK